MSPTQRALAVLKEVGATVAIVEKFVRFPPPGHRVDLFGFIDILAIRDGKTLGIQVTTDAHVAERVLKIRASPHLPILLAAGWQISVWGFSKKGPRGKRKTWTLREVIVA